MTRQQMYRELERMYCDVNWNDRESIHRYNERARELRQLVYEQEDNERQTAKRKEQGK